MKREEIRTVVVGSGAAGLACALRLFMLGQPVALVTEGINKGTSRNAGSDKQTYYKLSLAGDAPESVGQMARDLFAPGGMDGDMAYAQAALSARCFYFLAELGVPFPHNEAGEYVGYRTDHDKRSRATSAGPLTSRYMVQALEREVRKAGIPLHDGLQAVRVQTDGGGVTGLVCADVQTGGLTEFACAHVVLATGGEAGLYQKSVFPACQTGGMGLAAEAGAGFANLNHWQYGLASLSPRWNLSGSYQQALPRYVRITPAGEESCLFGAYLSAGEALRLTFLKGYEWPFDAAKLPGSSLIDLIVYHETVTLGNRVALDYTRNPAGLENGLAGAGEEACAYLEKSGAIKSTPIERLVAMNPGAAELYLGLGVDLRRQMLPIWVCAQHQNGGVEVDAHWQSRIPGLYAIGEVAGTFGAYRPGGSALNAGQVGALRAALSIARSNRRPKWGGAGEEIQKRVEAWKGNPEGQWQPLEDFCPRMDAHAAFLRSKEGMEALLGDVRNAIEAFDSRMAIRDSRETAAAFKAWHTLLSMEQTLKAMLYSARAQGSCAGALVRAKSGWQPLEGYYCAQTAKEAREIVLGAPDGLCLRPPGPLPAPRQWFEAVWRDFAPQR